LDTLLILKFYLDKIVILTLLESLEKVIIK